MAAHQAPPSLGFSRQEHWRWWGTGKPDILQSMGSWRVRHDLTTEQQQAIAVLQGNCITQRRRNKRTWGTFVQYKRRILQFWSPCIIANKICLVYYPNIHNLGMERERNLQSNLQLKLKMTTSYAGKCSCTMVKSGCFRIRQFWNQIPAPSFTSWESWITLLVTMLTSIKQVIIVVA